MIENAFFLRRLNDHTQYLNKVNATLRGDDNFTGTHACSCKLGHWLCGKGKKEIEYYGQEPLRIFLELYQEHKKFHDVSNIALNKQLTDKNTEKNQAFTKMHILSANLVNLLLKLDTLTSQRKETVAA